MPYFKQLVALVEAEQAQKSVRVHYALQTNGMLINQKWAIFLKSNHFLVGLSIDGHPMYHDLHRLYTKGKGTFHRVLETKRLFDAYQIEYNILCVLTNQLAKEPKKVYQFMQKEKIDYIQFIPCLDELQAKKRSTYALTPERFASFYRQLLHLWLQELSTGYYRSVKLFDDVFNLVVNRQVNACGLVGNCQIQYTIEADGSVYPCDFYVLDEYRLGFIQEQTLRELFSQDIGQKFLCEKKKQTSYVKLARFNKCVTAVANAWKRRCMSMLRVIFVAINVFYKLFYQKLRTFKRIYKRYKVKNALPNG